MATDGAVVSAGVVGVEPPLVAAVLAPVSLSAPPSLAPPPQAVRKTEKLNRKATKGVSFLTLPAV
jgi:hypothetical protein